MSPISPHVPSAQATGREVELCARPTSGSVTDSTSSCDAMFVVASSGTLGPQPPAEQAPVK
jgi:hypothetical protein